MSRILLSISLLLLHSSLLLAQGPNGTGTYYRPAEGKCGAELKTAFHQVIRSPRVVGYGGLKAAYALTDIRPDGMLRDWYSNATAYAPGSDFSTATKEEGLGYNREHLIPQSWFGKKVDPMYSDITHVVPTDARLNTQRNDNPFGEVTSYASQVSTSKNGYSRWGAPSATLGTPAGLTKVFEPNDELKGDIARIYFYMITCYEDRLTSWPWRDSRTATFVFDEDGTAYEPLRQWAMDMLMRWSEQDPVDSIERARNEAVYRVQGNRNPFVDYPGVEKYIWGELRNEPFSYGDGTKPDDETASVPSTVTINFSSQFFGGEWVGVRPAAASSVLHGTKDGIDVELALGNEGRNMYLGKDHIRLYQKNLLTFTDTRGRIDNIKFSVTKNEAGKVLTATDGTVDGYHREGPAPTVTFQLDDGNGVFYLASATLTRTATDGIADIAETRTRPEATYDLQGRRLHSKRPLTHGLYIVGGRKVLFD